MSGTITVELEEYQWLKRVFDALYAYDKKPNNKNARLVTESFDGVEAFYSGDRKRKKEKKK